MKTVRTVKQVLEKNERLNLKPKYKKSQYLQCYCGSYEDHCFTVLDIRYNHDINRFEYFGRFGINNTWIPENFLVIP